MRNVLIKYKIVLCLLMAISLQARSQANWTGKVSTDWATAANWSTGMVPDSSVNVQVGIVPFDHQPVIGASAKIKNLTFGGIVPVILTINAGDSLQVSGQVVQDHGTGNVGPSTTLTGPGSLTCSAMQIGDLIGPKLVQSKTTTLTSSIARLTVTGSITLNSATSNLLTGGIANNNSYFSLQGGVMNLNKKIITTNRMPPGCSPSGANLPNAKFSIDITGSQNATLVLLDSSAVMLANPAYGMVDFYHPVAGSGRSLVKYAGANQLVYTNTTAGIDSLSGNYQDLTIAGMGIKTAGNASPDKLHIAGDLKITGGTFDLQTYNPTTLVDGNFSNTGAIVFGTSTTTFDGSNFFNAGGFTVGIGVLQFSGGSQSLVDSTLNGTNFQRVSFNNTGTKNIQSGKFAVIPNGKIRLSSSANLNVTSGALLIIRADSTGSAGIAALASGCTVTGRVNVEQFIQGSLYLGDASARGYRFLSSPVNFTGTLSGERNFNVSFVMGTTDFNGIYTTGATGGGFISVGNPTMYLFREDVSICNGSPTCGNDIGIAKINYADTNLIGTQKRFTQSYIADTTTYLPVATGFYCFFRGNKVADNGSTAGTKTTNPFNYPESVTMVHTGTVNQGNVQTRNWFRTDHYLSFTRSPLIHNAPGDRGVSLLGNPYPAAVNWDNFSATDSTAGIYAPHVLPTLYIITPGSSQYGTYLPDSTHDKTQVYHGTGIATNILSIGEGFDIYVDSTATNPNIASLTFREGAKFDTDAGSTPGTFSAAVLSPLSRLSVSSRKAAVQVAGVQANGKIKSSGAPVPVSTEQLIRLTLFADTTQYDDILIRFRAGATPGFNLREDAYDRGGTENATVSLSSYSSDHVPLSINTLPLQNQNILLFTDAKQSGTFRLNADALQNIPANYVVRLLDKFTGKTITLRQGGHYTFTIDKNLKKTYGDRFELVIVKTK